jgi:sulfite reductase (NADPH) hemoprotein beta-component
MKVITANRLLDGDVVWLGENDVWVERVTLARTFDGKDDVAEGLSIGAAAEKDQKMYRYDEFDHAFVEARVNQFRDQVERRLSGEISEDEFKPLRLMNGVYLQLHAYMLRVAIPYGTLNSRQMRKLAHIARTYDRGYGHFTTRQNIQYNWPALSDMPAILEELAEVEMHAIQTSGNCIRNVTADHFAGAAADEVADPRPYAEILRQWSSVHPEFSFLPRKFKIAVTGSERDRAAIQVHDIGLQLKKDDEGRTRLRRLDRRRAGADADLGQEGQ